MLDSLKKIQQDYVSLVLSHFVMERKEYQSSGKFLSSPTLYTMGRNGFSDLIEYKTFNYLNELKDFWTTRWPALQNAVQTTTGIGVTIWGDMGIDTLLPKYGLYFDTIAIPDQILFVPAERLENRKSLEHYYRNFIIWTSIIEDISPAILADLDHPMAVVFPQQFSLSTSVDKSVSDMHNNSNLLAGSLLQDIFKTNETHLTAEGFEEEIRIKGRTHLIEKQKQSNLLSFLLPIIENSSNLISAKEEGVNFELLKQLQGGLLESENASHLFGMVGSLFYLQEAREKTAHCINMDNTVSSGFASVIRSKHRILSEDFKQAAGLNEEDIVSYSFAHNFNWLDNLTSKEAVILREEGVFEETREVFRIDRRRIKHASFEDFPSISQEFEKRICDVIERELEKEKQALNCLNKKTRNTYISFGASAILGMASLAFPELIPLSIGAAGYGALVGGASVKDIVNQHLSGEKTIKKFSDRPVTFLIGAYQSGKDV